MELEVLDVDPLDAERLRDPREHARPVGHADEHALQLARVGERALEQAALVDAGLADPAGEEARVARLERGLELLDAAAVLGEGGGERVRVLEEDVDPDARVRAGHAGHVPQRTARRAQRLVAVHSRGADLVQEQVRERVRQVAREREQAVVRARVDGDGGRAERGDETVQEPVALRVARRGRGQEPGRALEQLGARVLRAVRLGARNGMAADEAWALHRRADGRLRRADVGDGAVRRLERLLGESGNRGDRPRADGEIGAGDGLLDARGGLDRAALDRERERLGVRVEAGHPLGARARGGEPDRGADQPRAEDRDPTDACCHEERQAPRSSSESRNARSRDWRALSRGSQRVS